LERRHPDGIHASKLLALHDYFQGNSSLTGVHQRLDEKISSTDSTNFNGYFFRLIRSIR
jgi:hypothetical protein